MNVVKSLYLAANIYLESLRKTAKRGNAHIRAIEEQVVIPENTIEIINGLPKTHKVCKRCGRKLKSEASQRLGYGTTCYLKHIKESRMRPLFRVARKER